MDIMNYIKPELIVVALVCYIIGFALKNTALIKDKFIPLVIGAVSVVLCCLWVLATSPLDTPADILLAVFTAIVQAVLVAGLSTYVNQFIKQTFNKEE